MVKFDDWRQLHPSELLTLALQSILEFPSSHHRLYSPSLPKKPSWISKYLNKYLNLHTHKGHQIAFASDSLKLIHPNVVDLCRW